MKFFLMRHSEAGEHLHAEGEPDPDPPLLPEGRDMAAAMAGHMKSDDWEPTIVISSPLKRAKQTAEAIRATFKLPPVVIEDAAGPTAHRGPSLAVLIKKIARDESMKRVAIVSHHDQFRKALAILNMEDETEIDPYAKAEYRVLDVDRETGQWDELDRACPSDEGFEDIYG